MTQLATETCRPRRYGRRGREEYFFILFFIRESGQQLVNEEKEARI